jgi:hypothetical protein
MEVLFRETVTRRGNRSKDFSLWKEEVGLPSREVALSSVLVYLQ